MCLKLVVLNFDTTKPIKLDKIDEAKKNFHSVGDWSEFLVFSPILVGEEPDDRTGVVKVDKLNRNRQDTENIFWTSTHIHKKKH